MGVSDVWARRTVVWVANRNLLVASRMTMTVYCNCAQDTACQLLALTVGTVITGVLPDALP